MFGITCSLDLDKISCENVTTPDELLSIDHIDSISQTGVLKQRKIVNILKNSVQRLNNQTGDTYVPTFSDEQRKRQQEPDLDPADQTNLMEESMVNFGDSPDEPVDDDPDDNEPGDEPKDFLFDKVFNKFNKSNEFSNQEDERSVRIQVWVNKSTNTSGIFSENLVLNQIPTDNSELHTNSEETTAIVKFQVNTPPVSGARHLFEIFKQSENHKQREAFAKEQFVLQADKLGKRSLQLSYDDLDEEPVSKKVRDQ